MSKRDLEDYFVRVSSDYSEMRHLIDEMQYAVDTNKMSQQALDQIKQSAENLKSNYMTLSYIMFLLNKPVKKSKQAGYEKREQKKLNNIDKKHTREEVEKRNDEDLKNIKQYVL